jgi:hypothetical protein
VPEADDGIDLRHGILNRGGGAHGVHHGIELLEGGLLVPLLNSAGGGDGLRQGEAAAAHC